MAIKQRLLTIRQTQTQLSTQQIALAAGVSLTEAYLVEIGGFVDPDLARKVVNAFSRLSGQRLTLDDIRLQNIPPVKLPFSEKREWML